MGAKIVEHECALKIVNPKVRNHEYRVKRVELRVWSQECVASVRAILAACCDCAEQGLVRVTRT